MKKRLLIILVMISTLSGGLLSCVRVTSEQTQTGILDLRGFRFDEHNTADLDVEWEFYWNRLISPEEFKDKESLPEPSFFKLPGIWNGRVEKGETLNGNGFATFRLTILVPEQAPRYGFKLPEMATAYRLYVNGALISSNGVVSSAPEIHRPRFLPKTVFFRSHEKIEAVLHISNYSDRDGGCWNSILFGTEDAVQNVRIKALASDIFVFGILFMMGFYYLAFYAIRRKEISSLAFSGVCFLMAIRMLMMGERMFLSFFPDISWEAAIKIEHLTLYLAPLIATCFIYTLFPDVTSIIAVYFWAAAGAVSTLAVLLLPASIHGYMMDIYQAAIVAGLIYLIIVPVRALAAGRDGAMLILTGVIAILLTAVNDILHDNGIIVSQMDMIPAGTFILVLTNSVALLKRFTIAFKNEEKLTSSLREVNAARDRLLTQYMDSRLNAAQERCKPHFIFNAVHTLLYLIKKDADRAENAVILLADMLRYLTDRSFESSVSFHEEWKFTEDYLGFLKTGFGEELNFTLETTGDLSGVTLPPLTIQPLIENAFRHGVKGRASEGIIEVRAYGADGMLTVTVTDNGHGIDCESPFQGTLGGIRDRLTHVYPSSQLTLERPPEGGTRASLKIPI